MKHPMILFFTIFFCVALPLIAFNINRAGKYDADMEECNNNSLRLLKLFNYLDSATTFTDGEGNKIPRDIVQLEIKSHFVKITKAEKDSINKYFYTDTLK